MEQDDQVLQQLTVGESLRFAAALRLSHLTPAAREARVASLLAILRLASCEGTQVGDSSSAASRGISGGERKRLCIACELLTMPSLLFLDASRQMARAAAAHGCGNAARYAAEAAHIATHVDSELYNGGTSRDDDPSAAPLWLWLCSSAAFDAPRRSILCMLTATSTHTRHFGLRRSKAQRTCGISIA